MSAQVRPGLDLSDPAEVQLKAESMLCCFVNLLERSDQRRLEFEGWTICN